jgi:hypothetical protein
MSSVVETINGKVFTWDKGGYGCGVYRVNGRPMPMQAWAAARADAVRASRRAVPRGWDSVPGGTELTDEAAP